MIAGDPGVDHAHLHLRASSKVVIPRFKYPGSGPSPLLHEFRIARRCVERLHDKVLLYTGDVGVIFEPLHCGGDTLSFPGIDATPLAARPADRHPIGAVQ